MLKHFHIGDAKACIITFDDITSINKAVIRLRKVFPELPIIARAKNPQHQQRLQSMFGRIRLSVTATISFLTDILLHYR